MPSGPPLGAEFERGVADSAPLATMGLFEWSGGDASAVQLGGEVGVGRLVVMTLAGCDRSVAKRG